VRPAALGVGCLGRFRDYGVAVAGSVEVGIDFPQSCEFKPFAQFGDRKGTERELVFAWLDPVTVLEDEDQMGNVLFAEAIWYLPGIEHHASSPVASHRLI